MPFDPTIPKEQTEIDAVELRNQFNGLKAIFDLQIAALQSQLNSLAPVAFCSNSELPPGSFFIVRSMPRE